MKKVKIMLMAVLVVAAVGGALAFKAKKGQNLFCGDFPTTCPDPVGDIYTLTTKGTQVPGEFCSFITSTICETVTFND
jgi:hypothetical protein